MKQLQTIKLTIEGNNKGLEHSDTENPIICSIARKQMQPLGMITHNVGLASTSLFYNHLLQYKIKSNVKTDIKYLNSSLKCLKDLS